ncbi:MAG: CARDB domain-containing protein [Anaerolineae bacterium]
MANGSKFCQNCGQPLAPGLRFCEHCGHPVSESPATAGPPGRASLGVPEGTTGAPASNPPPAAFVPSGPPVAPQWQAQPVLPQQSPQPAAPLPWIIAGLALALLCLVIAGGAVLYFSSSSRTGQPAAAIAPITSSPLAMGTPSAVSGTATDLSQVNTVTPVPPGPSVTTAAPAGSPVNTPSPASTPTFASTDTPVPTATAIAGPSGYDLYVRRIDYVPSGADLAAGMAVRFAIMIATDIYPAAGPYFPTTHFRWRPGDGTVWAEALCPASTQNANCNSSIYYTYTQPGSYTFEVEVDNRSEIVESNENNNGGRVTVPVNAAPLPTAVPPPTAAPLPTAIPPAAPAFGAITFSTDFDQNSQRPVNPGTTFAYGPKIIYSWWTFRGITPGTVYSYSFYKDGSLFYGGSDRFNYASGNAWQWVLIGDYPTVALDAGTYWLSIYVNNKIVTSGSFVIQPPAIGGPIPGAFSVFFTIQNGAPTGWVYDKQGVKHSPASGTISGLQVAPGDRIVLQTDQARFSLLFDCSTTPGTFDPCDFMSASTANLPGQVRVVKRGMSAFLNISRADNWAGARNGFPGQRYPADPVLRIMFSW